MPENNLNPTAMIAKNSAVQFAAGLLNKVLGVALIIYAARKLGTEGFGQYTLVLSLHAMFYIITDFGLGTLTTRDLAKDSGRESGYFTNVLVLRCLLSVIAGLGMLATALVLGYPPEVLRLTAIVGLSFFFISNIDTATAIFNAHQRMEITSTISVAANAVRVVASLAALLLGGGVMSLIWIHTGYALMHMAVLFFVLQFFIRPTWKLDPGFWKKMLLQAYPLALANLFSVIYFRVDSIMLAAMTGEHAVGLYNAAYRLLELTLIIPAYYGGAIFPVISASHANNPQRFLLIYRRSMKYMWIVSLPMAAGAVVLAPHFIDILYGPQYAASIPVLSILMWTLVLIAVNSINAPYLIVMGKQHLVTILVGTSMVANIGLNMVLIPYYGMLGAAWVTLFSEALNVALFMIALRDPLEMKLRMLHHFVRPLLAVAGMIGLLYWIAEWDLGYQVVVGGILYVFLLWVLRAFDEVDVELFTRILRPTQTSEKKIT